MAYIQNSTLLGKQSNQILNTFRLKYQLNDLQLIIGFNIERF